MKHLGLSPAHVGYFRRKYLLIWYKKFADHVYILAALVQTLPWGILVELVALEKVL
jgi:hypothetical protein